MSAVTPTPSLDSIRPARQFELLSQARYQPFFWTVFLGTFNDNLLKFAITILLTYQVQLTWLPPAQVGPALGALFMVPSLLLSAWCGQLADKWPLDRLIRWGKALEVVMMTLAAWALLQRQVPLLLLCVLLSGIHVTLFATVKYAYLPRHLSAPELIGGNGLLEMGMFMAILLGTLVGGPLIMGAWVPPDWPPRWSERATVWAVPVLIMAVSLVGWWRSQAVPLTRPTDPGLVLHFSVWRESWRHVRFSQGQGGVLLSILGISWMWFFGAMFMMLFPALTRDVLHAQASVASWLLVLVSLGIGAGALCCERLSRGRQPLVLVPVGALGMAVFGGDVAWLTWQMGQAPQVLSGEWGLQAFLTHPPHARLMLDVWLMAMSVGLFSVPLYADMQARSSDSHRARIVAANNILNAVAMVLSALMAGGLLAAGLSLGAVLGTTVALHVLICILHTCSKGVGREKP